MKKSFLPSAALALSLIATNATYAENASTDNANNSVDIEFILMSDTCKPESFDAITNPIVRYSDLSHFQKSTFDDETGRYLCSTAGLVRGSVVEQFRASNPTAANLMARLRMSELKLQKNGSEIIANSNTDGLLGVYAFRP
jgi:hypothetical protein